MIRSLLLLLVVSGCSSPEYEHPSSFLHRNSPMLQSNEIKERKALDEDRMTEARKVLRREVILHLRESRTNQPDFLLPK